MKKQVHRGIFDLKGRKVPGMLAIKSGRSTLELWSDQFFHVHRGTLHGTTAEAKAVSVFNCLESHPKTTTNRPQRREGFSVANIGFEACTIGHGEHLEAHDESVVAVEFSFAELEFLARTGLDGPYSYIPDPDQALIESLQRHKPDHAPDVEEGVMLAYFGGETTALPETPTEIGTVSITRSLEVQVGGGVAFEDQPSVVIDFDSPVTVMDAIHRMNALRHFFGLSMGYLPVLEGARVATARRKQGDNRLYPAFDLDLHCPMLLPGVKEPPRYRLLNCDGHARKVELASVLATWLKRNADPNRENANWRFFECLFEGRHFTINRIVAAANMFDLLPTSDWPSPKLKDLKKKVGCKTKLVLQAIGSQHLQELEVVVDHAVACRNHYVHGTPAKLDYDRSLPFLTDSLEFVYGVSELIECGWNAQRLFELQPPDHRFAAYVRLYDSYRKHNRI